MEQRTPILDREFVQRLKTLFAERDVECPDCGYSLSGVPGPRCPECGRHISGLLRDADTMPWRVRSYRSGRLRRRVMSVVRWLLVLATIGVMACAAVYWAWF